jgi:Spy/CpxP family protein refolding chaperone
MKKSSEIMRLAGLVAAAFLIPSLPAAEPAAAPTGLARRLYWRHAIVQRLGLTEAQQTAVRAQREQLRAELTALRGDSSLGAEERRVRAAGIIRTHRAQVRALLTPEQVAKIRHFREKRAGLPRHGNRGSGSPGGQRAGRELS